LNQVAKTYAKKCFFPLAYRFVRRYTKAEDFRDIIDILARPWLQPRFLHL